MVPRVSSSRRWKQLGASLSARLLDEVAEAESELDRALKADNPGPALAVADRRLRTWEAEGSERWSALSNDGARQEVQALLQRFALLSQKHGNLKRAVIALLMAQAIRPLPHANLALVVRECLDAPRTDGPAQEVYLAALSAGMVTPQRQVRMMDILAPDAGEVSQPESSDQHHRWLRFVAAGVDWPWLWRRLYWSFHENDQLELADWAAAQLKRKGPGRGGAGPEDVLILFREADFAGLAELLLGADAGLPDRAQLRRALALGHLGRFDEAEAALEDLGQELAARPLVAMQTALLSLARTGDEAPLRSRARMLKIRPPRWRRYARGWLHWSARKDRVPGDWQRLITDQPESHYAGAVWAHLAFGILTGESTLTDQELRLPEATLSGSPGRARMQRLLRATDELTPAGDPTRLDTTGHLAMALRHRLTDVSKSQVLCLRVLDSAVSPELRRCAELVARVLAVQLATVGRWQEAQSWAQQAFIEDSESLLVELLPVSVLSLMAVGDCAGAAALARTHQETVDDIVLLATAELLNGGDVAADRLFSIANSPGSARDGTGLVYELLGRLPSQRFGFRIVEESPHWAGRNPWENVPGLEVLRRAAEQGPGELAQAWSALNTSGERLPILSRCFPQWGEAKQSGCRAEARQAVTELWSVIVGEPPEAMEFPHEEDLRLEGL